MCCYYHQGVPIPRLLHEISHDGASIPVPVPARHLAHTIGHNDHTLLIFQIPALHDRFVPPTCIMGSSPRPPSVNESLQPLPVQSVLCAIHRQAAQRWIGQLPLSTFKTLVKRTPHQWTTCSETRLPPIAWAVLLMCRSFCAACRRSQRPFIE